MHDEIIQEFMMLYHYERHDYLSIKMIIVIVSYQEHMPSYQDLFDITMDDGLLDLDDIS